MKSEPYVEIEENGRPRWLDMTPVKRYKHFTLFYKASQKGAGYYECFLNQEIDNKKKGAVTT